MMREPATNPDSFDRFAANLARAGVALLAAGLVGIAAPQCGCGPARNGLASITPTVPRAAVCIDGAARCVDGRPESCRTYDDVTRWWPLTPLDHDGRPARCAARCVVDGVPAVAHCDGPADGGAP